MEKEKITKLERRSNELFGKGAVVSVSQVKVADKGYVVRIKMQGMPFEISAMDETLEKAESIAYDEFNKNMEDALENSLFPTQSKEKYEEVKLSEEQLDRLFKYEDMLPKKILDDLKKKTIAKICALDGGRYECVIENPYNCLHARGTSGMKKLAILSATMVAHDVFKAPVEYVGKRPWSN